MPVSLNFPLPAPSVPVGQGKSFYCLSFWMCLFLNGGLRWNGWLLWIPSCCWIEKKIESKCNMKFGDCQTMFESDLTVSQISNFHYLTIGIHILKGLSIRTRRKSKISVSRRWFGGGVVFELSFVLHSWEYLCGWGKLGGRLIVLAVLTREPAVSRWGQLQPRQGVSNTEHMHTLWCSNHILKCAHNRNVFLCLVKNMY